MSPDGEAIVTGAGDETLRFWNVFSKTRSTKVTWLGGVHACPPAIAPLGSHSTLAHSHLHPLFPGICVCAQPLHPDPIDPQAGFAAPWTEME